jgi:hypothetical protein
MKAILNLDELEKHLQNPSWVCLVGANVKLQLEF